VLDIHVDHLKVPDGSAGMTHLAGHFFAFKCMVRIRIHPCRTKMPVDFFGTVRGVLAVEMMSFHGSGKTSAFGYTNDIDGGHLLEDIHPQFLAYLESFHRTAEFADEPFGFAAGFGKRLDPGRHKSFLPLGI